MNERDMEYLGNINTSPGPNAGRSIDPTKPGPAALAQSEAEPVAWREALEQQLFDLVELARDTRSDKGGEAQWIHPVSGLIREFTKRITAITALPRPDAEPGILHNTVGGFKEVATRDTPGIYDNNAQPRLVEEIHDFDRQLIGFRVYDAIAQSDAEPVAWHNLPPIPDDDTDFTPDLARAIIAKYQEAIRTLTTPPRPAASAGLIEAAEILETDSHYSGSNAARWLQEAANILRARAADRSEK